MTLTIRLLIAFMLAAASPLAAGDSDFNQLQQQVRETEQAFAQTMAERDFEAFVSFLSPEAIFFSGDAALRGSEAVATAWKPYFEQADAPFSWEPGTVEVLDSGSLALSSGPVQDPAGKCVGSYTSIWRLEESGQWKIVFDKGSRDCPEE